MARALRLEYPGAVVYVTGKARGGRKIYRDAKDRKRFLELLGTIGPEERWKIHAYALLEDRFELLIEMPAGGLSHGMRSLNGRYTQYFNRRHGREGALLEGRFRSVLVQKERYLLEMCRHVVWSPVREGLSRQPGGWPSTNFRAAAGREPVPAWLEADWTLDRLARGRPAALRAYRRFVEQGRRAPSPLDDMPKQGYLGDRRFLQNARRLLSQPAARKRVRRRFRAPHDLSVGEIQRVIAREWDVSSARLRRGHGGEGKVAGIYLARKLTPLSNMEIGRAFGVGEARVSSALREVQEGARTHLVPRLEELRRRLSRRSALRR
jgi:REP element-mobilizing transposase RayT